MITEASPIVSPALAKELKELVKARSRNTLKIGQVILKMVTDRPGGLNDKNQAAVFQHLRQVYSFTYSQLLDYVKLGRGTLLVEVCNMPTVAARIAAKLDIKHQKVLVFNGADVVVDLTKPAIKKRLHELTDEEAERLIDERLGRIRDTKTQRQLMQAVPPPVRDRILEVWGSGKNTYIRLRRRAPLVDIEFALKELKRYKCSSISDPKVRKQLELDLAREFPRPNGVSPA